MCGFDREHVAGDVYHYSKTLRLGTGPNAAIRLHRVVRERAPFTPQPADDAAVLLHGDFATFVTNFAPSLGTPASPQQGLAPYLASRDLDVWGVDRRWTLATADGDRSDFASMGLAQELDDLRAALAVVRSVRESGGCDGRERGKVSLVGFSHGAQIAYAYASSEAARPSRQRHVDALVALDFFGAYGPSEGDLRAASCQSSADGYAAVAAGVTESSNEFFINGGQAARAAPNEVSGIDPSFTNIGLVYWALGQTYQLAPITPTYHLLAPVLRGADVVGFSATSDDAATAWLAGAPPYQPVLESADLDALLCGEGALPVDVPLSRIKVPLFYIGAAGGVGELGLYSATQVASRDVTTLVFQRFGGDRIAEDYGHGDLLYSGEAQRQVWKPLAKWLARH